MKPSSNPRQPELRPTRPAHEVRAAVPVHHAAALDTSVLDGLSVRLQLRASRPPDPGPQTS